MHGVYCRRSISVINICVVLQIDQCRYFVRVLTIFIRDNTKMYDNGHIVDMIHAHVQVYL